ncbi:MAG: hypothetical protein ACRENC_07405, partial [Gemmatimonadaceae bacterium]
PRVHNPALSESAERIILTCLAKDPADRYPSGEALRADLAQLLAHGGPLQESTTVVMPAAPDERAGGRRHALKMPGWFTRPRTLVVGVAAAAVLLAGSAAAMRWRGGQVADAPPPVTHDAPATLPPVSASAPAPRPVLHIVAPASATIEIDGFHLAPGTHDVPNIPGTHRVAAVLPSVHGCSWAHDESTVLVLDTGVTSVSLSPRSCGFVAPDIAPAAATWTVLATSGGTLAHGSGASADSAPLPVGHHALEVSAPYCATYRAPVVVSAGQTTRVRIRLLCERTHQ